MQLSSFSDLLQPVESAGASPTASPNTDNNGQAFADILQRVPGTADSATAADENEATVTAPASPAASGEIMPAPAKNHRFTHSALAVLKGKALNEKVPDAQTAQELLNSPVADILQRVPSPTDSATTADENEAAATALASPPASDDIMPAPAKNHRFSHSALAVLNGKALNEKVPDAHTAQELLNSPTTDIAIKQKPGLLKAPLEDKSGLDLAVNADLAKPTGQPIEGSSSIANDGNTVTEVVLPNKTAETLTLDAQPQLLNTDIALPTKTAVQLEEPHAQETNSATISATISATNKLAVLPNFLQETANAQPTEANVASNLSTPASTLTLNNSDVLPAPLAKEIRQHAHAVSAVDVEQFVPTATPLSSADKASQLFSKMTGKAIGIVKHGQTNQTEIALGSSPAAADLFQLLNKRDITIAQAFDKITEGTLDQSQYEQPVATAPPSIEQGAEGTTELLSASTLPAEDFSTLLHSSVAMGTYAWTEETSNQVHWLRDQDLDSATLQLHPQELGRIDINIEVKEGQTYVHFHAANPEARELLQSSLPSLRDLLAQGGLLLAEGHVDQQLNRNTNPFNEAGSSRDGSRDGSKDGSRDSSREPGTRQSVEELPLLHQQAQRHSLYQVDYYA
jgi:flagellar hook-length control protein FliK